MSKCTDSKELLKKVDEKERKGHCPGILPQDKGTEPRLKMGQQDS
jgi:hypothetical protein